MLNMLITHEESGRITCQKYHTSYLFLAHFQQAYLQKLFIVATIQNTNCFFFCNENPIYSVPSNNQGDVAIS